VTPTMHLKKLDKLMINTIENDANFNPQRLKMLKEIMHSHYSQDLKIVFS